MGTVPGRPYETRWADAWIALAGPLTGLPVALGALLLTEQPPDAVRWALFVSIVLGLLNLAPMMPLDGGRVVLALVSGLSPLMRTAIAFTPIAFVVVIAATAGTAALALGPVLLVVLSIVMTHAALRRQAHHAWMLAAAAPPAAIRRALRDVTACLDGAATEDADGGVPPDPVTSGRAAILLVAYAALVLVLLWLSARLAPVLPEMGVLRELGLVE
jgi:membrane-associated protease RseP (regulator of RpoE activity)